MFPKHFSLALVIFVKFINKTNNFFVVFFPDYERRGMLMYQDVNTLPGCYFIFYRIFLLSTKLDT